MYTIFQTILNLSKQVIGARSEAAAPRLTVDVELRLLGYWLGLQE